MDDPLLHGLIHFSVRYGRLILSIVVVWLAAGLALGLSEREPSTAMAILQVATTAREGPVQDVEIVADHLEKHVGEKAALGELLRGTSLTATPVRGQPPAQESTSLLEVVATAGTREAAAKAIEAAASELFASQNVLFREEQARLSRHIASLEEGLERNRAEKLTPDTHAVFVQLVRELMDTYRLTSPSRAFEARFIGEHAILGRQPRSAVTLFTLAGLLGGIVCAYTVAFFVAGIRAQRSASLGGAREPPAADRS